MRKAIAAVLVLVLVLSLSACTPQKKVLGTWKHQSNVFGIVTETLYTFNEDGTGTMSTLVDIAFTYTIDDNVLRITTTVLEMSHTDTYTYQFDGDKLTLTGDNETLELTKVK
ncbi:MAG: hypothetical protein E7470_02160 [Ruminococcaceae bacterium]|nr:hypothetical protein [Oscillospiraceae bacterium]